MPPRKHASTNPLPGADVDQPPRSTPTSRPRKRTSARSDAVAVSAQTVLSSWIEWYRGIYANAPIPESTVARLGKHVKELVASGFREDHIKWGLAEWTCLVHDNHRTSPQELLQLVWRHAMDDSTQGTQHRADVRARLAAANGSAQHQSAKQRREQRSADALHTWLANQPNGRDQS